MFEFWEHKHISNRKALQALLQVVKTTNVITAGYDLIQILVQKTAGRSLMMISVFIK